MERMKTSDNEIIDRILRGEEHGYAVLLQRYRARVFSLALRIVRSREEAEEAAQDAFVRAFRSLSRFERRSKFSTWLYRITYNVSLNHAQRLQKDRILTPHEEEDGIESDDIPADLVIEQSELKGLVVEVLKTMKPEYATVLSLFYTEDQSYEEIADITGLPLGTVKNRLHRARAVLRSLVIKKYSYVEATKS
jgi:RNA polymerase sigma-70 factor (ECF subfamily)